MPTTSSRVVITGVGPITSIGCGKEAFWKGLLAGASGIGRIVSFDASDYRSHRGAEVKDFHPRETYRYAIAAASE